MLARLEKPPPAPVPAVELSDEVVGPAGLFVRSVALLVKAISLPSGLKTGSLARPSDCRPSGVAVTSVVVAVVRFRIKMLLGKGSGSEYQAAALVGSVKSVPLAVRSVYRY